jgi:hypothetical protein
MVEMVDGNGGKWWTGNGGEMVGEMVDRGKWWGNGGQPDLRDF